MKKKTILIGIIGFLVFLQPIHAQTWNATKRLTWNSGDSYVPCVAVDANNHIHVVLGDNTTGNDEIYYKKSTNGGTSWTTKRLTWNSGDSKFARIAVDSNNHIHVVWDDDTPGNFEIYYKKSTNGGTSWSTRRLTWSVDDSRVPRIAVDSASNIYVSWHDYTPGNDEVFFKRSTDGGTSWMTKRLTFNSGSSAPTDIAVDTNDHIHLVWCDETPSWAEIYYKKSEDGGASWVTKRLTFNSSDSYFPGVATDSNNHIYVVWFDYSPGNAEIYYKKSTNGGTSWTTKRLTFNSSPSMLPVIATDSHNRIHIAWVDDAPGNNEIYYKRSTNGGSSWMTKRLSYNSGWSDFPDLALGSNNHIHVVWQDDTPGNTEILFRKGIQ